MKLFLKMMVFAGLLYSAEAYSWGVTGHRTVAEIAQRHLSKKAKRNIKKIIGSQKLANLANWADNVKSDTTNVYKETEVWHYVNVKSGLNYNEFESSIKALTNANLYSQILKEEAVLKNKASSKEEKIFALKFLIHLVGDLHQPLHVGHAEDLGGNQIQLSFFRENTNLHTLWDSKLVDFQKYSYSEYAGVLDIKSNAEVLKDQSGTLESWLFESYTKASKLYTQTKPNTNYSYDYNYKFSPLLDEQLYLGGVRLAKILNEVLQ